MQNSMQNNPSEKFRNYTGGFKKYTEVINYSNGAVKPVCVFFFLGKVEVFFPWVCVVWYVQLVINLYQRLTSIMGTCDSRTCKKKPRKSMGRSGGRG